LVNLSRDCRSVIKRFIENILRQLAGVSASLDSPVLSDSQNVSGASQEICRDGNGTIGKRETRERSESGRVATMPFLHLGVRNEDSKAPDTKAIEEVLNKAKDWYRYAPNCWIIYTSKDASTWAERLRAISGIEDHATFFICEINNENRGGWASAKFWDWFKKHGV
jgi:hypothetical protein